MNFLIFDLEGIIVLLRPGLELYLRYLYKHRVKLVARENLKPHTDRKADFHHVSV